MDGIAEMLDDVEKFPITIDNQSKNTYRFHSIVCPYLDGDGGLPLGPGEKVTTNWAYKNPLNPLGETDITVKWGEDMHANVAAGQTLVVKGDGTEKEVVG